MLITTFFMVALGGAAVQIPLSGDALTPAGQEQLKAVPGIERIELDRGTLSLDIASGQEVRLRDLVRALERSGDKGALNPDGLTIGPHTIFEINAGRCFYCAEAPLASTLSRKTFVRKWSVVDYGAKGRLRFRVETEAQALLGTFGSDSFEDVIFTSRYDGLEPLNLFWRTGGVAWRADEASARREATESRKPLMIFPTAGT